MNRNVEYMLLGLGAAWLIMFTYVVLITLRERKLRKELDRVRRMVENPEQQPIGDCSSTTTELSPFARVASGYTGRYESPCRLFSV